MAIYTARPRTGSRALLAAAIVGIAAVSLPASAISAPNLVGSSVENGWATSTRLVPECPAGCTSGRPFDPTDPPAQKADGVVEFVTSRWDKTLVTDATKSFITIKDVGGIPVSGKTVFDVVPGTTGSTYDYNKTFQYLGRPARVMTFIIGQTDASGNLISVGHLTAAGAPYTVSFTATALDFTGQPGASATPPPQRFGLDRKLPPAPTITSPVVFFRTCPPNFVFILGLCETVFGPTYDPSQFSFLTPGTPVVVKGTAPDPLTFPFEDADPEKYIETSGIKAVVIRLYNGGLSPYFFGSPFIKSYYLEQSCGDTYPGDASITRCPSTVAFSQDITADLIPGLWYAIDVYAIDLAGWHSAVAPNKPTNSDNRWGPETKSIAFFFAG